MPVEIVKNPRTKKTETLVNGVIGKVYYNALKNQQSFAGPNGVWEPTHSLSILVDGVKVNLGLTDKDGSSPKQMVGAKDADGKYHNLTEGVEVSIEITEVGEYNGKPTYDARTKNVLVLDASNAARPDSAAPKQEYTKKDFTGVEVGHALNCAMGFLQPDSQDQEEVLNTAKKFVQATRTLQKNYKIQNPDMSDYDVAASVGQAILSSARDGNFENIKEVVAYAEFLLSDVVAPLRQYVVESKEDSDRKESVEKRSEPKKAAGKPRAKPAPEPEPDIDQEDFDDDVPF